jgi:hypothetical protein
MKSINKKTLKGVQSHPLFINMPLSDMIRWWTKGRGSFNTELYIRICKAKNDAKKECEF